jgi:hypothetical protein
MLRGGGAHGDGVLADPPLGLRGRERMEAEEEAGEGGDLVGDRGREVVEDRANPVGLETESVGVLEKTA